VKSLIRVQKKNTVRSRSFRQDLSLSPGERSTVTHTGRGGTATGDAAAAGAQRAAQERAEQLAQAVRWINQQRRDGFNTSSPAERAQRAATQFGVSAGDVMRAWAAMGRGAEGAEDAQGG